MFIYAIGLAALFILIYVLSERKTVQLKNSCPHCLPYAWGYFRAYGVILSLIFIVGVLGFVVFHFHQEGESASAPRLFFAEKSLANLIGYSIALLVYGPINYLVIKRKRWAYLVAIVLSLNPVMWIFEGIYLRKRWDELSPNREKISPSSSSEDIATSIESGKPNKLRRLIGGGWYRLLLLVRFGASLVVGLALLYGLVKHGVRHPAEVVIGALMPVIAFYAPLIAAYALMYVYLWVKAGFDEEKKT